MAPEPSPVEPNSEAALIETAKHNPQAFGELYQRYLNQIYNYIYYRTGNREDAEDLTAKVFHKALANLHSYKDRGHPFSAWLYRIAHNIVANWYRDQNKRRMISLEDYTLVSSKKTSPYHQTLQNEQLSLLLEAINKLPPVRQHLLILKFIEGLPNAKIGRILNRSEGAVKLLYFRTLVQLREILIDHPEFFDGLAYSHED